MKQLILIGTTALFCLIVSSVSASNLQSANVVRAPKRLQMAVSCLFAAKWMRDYFFKSFGGFKEADWISVRYHIGTIPGIEPTPGAYKVLVYSKDGKHAFLVDAEPNSRGGFFASENDYTLQKSDSRWQVVEGEGGYVDYEAVERLVNRMSAKPLYRVQLVPGGKECSSD